MKLTDEQVERVITVVQNSGIKIEGLLDEIVDHLCCVIEAKLGKSKSFDELLQPAIKDLAPDGLDTLENETVFLLNHKRTIMLRKLMYVFGFFGAFVLTAGVMFKFLHLTGAKQLFNIGLLVLLLFFVPLRAMDRFKVDLSKVVSGRWKTLLGTISSIILGLAFIFKILHLTGGDQLLWLGMLVFSLGFLPLLFFRMYKSSE